MESAAAKVTKTDPGSWPPRPKARPPRRTGVRRFLLSSLSVLLSGCAYSFSGSALPSHIKTLAVPVFRNETLEYDLERELTEEVIAAFVRDNHLRIVGEGRADAVLLGRIVGYENKIFAYSSGETVEEYIVTLTVAVALKDQAENKELWKSDRLTATATYAVVERPGKPAMTEQEGRLAAVSELAEDILARTLEEW
jgi:hypothetical protein